MADEINSAPVTTTSPAAGSQADGGAPSQAPAQTQQQPPAAKGSKLSAREDVLAAFNEVEAKANNAGKSQDGAEGGTSAPAPKSADAKPGEPARGPDGKFVKAGEVPADAQAPQPGANGEQPKPINAPAAWKGSQKVDWNRLPRAVQEGIAEQFAAFDQLQAQYSPINAVLAPRMAALTAQYGSADKALAQLFALSDFADREPMAFINWFARQRQINFQQPANAGQNPGQQFAGQQAQAASVQNIPAELQPFMDELNGIKRFLASQQQAAQSALQQDQVAMTQQANSEVQAFIANSKDFPYANDVRNVMGAIFASGEAKILKDAYELAVWRVPEVRDRMIADRTQKEIDRQAQVAAEKKNASVSVSGSPGGQPAAPNRKATVRDDVLAAAKEIGFGGVARL